jgi:hypothetical protein
LDVFNALDLMENAKFLEQLKFGIGDGNLQYYVYNWKCPPMESNKVNSEFKGIFNGRFFYFLFFKGWTCVAIV